MWATKREIEEIPTVLFISQGELWARLTTCPHRRWVQAHVAFVDPNHANMRFLAKAKEPE